MAGQRPEWTSLLLWRRHGGILSDELPPNDQTPDFVGTLTHLSDSGTSRHALEGVVVSPAPRMVFSPSCVIREVSSCLNVSRDIRHLKLNALIVVPESHPMVQVLS